MSVLKTDCDILIIGFGPVGAAMAALLGRHGRSVVAIDAQHDVYPLPRAAHFDHEIMRIFQELGIIDRVAPHIRVAPNYEFRAADGRPLMRVEREGVNGISGWPTGFNFYQPGVEAAMRSKVSEMPHVDVRLGTKFVAVDSAGAEDVVVRTDSESEGILSCRARFVIGCDGASSSLREACGIALDDYGFDEPWLVLDALVEDESRFPTMNLQLCDPERPTTFVHMGPGRLRWEFMLKPGEAAEDMRRPESVDALLRPWRDKGEIKVERTAVYRFHGLVARSWRQGRILLAGDAAHQMPPFMGQGLCSGLRDAANLAWKLDSVLDTGNLSLLDTYQAERDPHVRTVIERAIEMGRLVCTLDPVRAARRDADMLPNPQITRASPLPGISGLTLDDSPAAGTLFPQPPQQADMAGLDDILGSGAWLVHRGSAPLCRKRPGLKIVPIESTLPADMAALVTGWLDGHNIDAVLVRPDRYIFGTGTAQMLCDAWMRSIDNERLAA